MQGTRKDRKRGIGRYPGNRVPRDGLQAGVRLMSHYHGERRDAEIIQRTDGSLLVRTDAGEYRSLTAAAQAITGYATNGWAFWRLAD
ncbi:MAG TPA: DUF2924 domain-containing protein [Dehalococcoidia bacterium]|nr:DUF2924 domain-containing protein [Dehalococcoidia bacterium]